MVAVDPLPADMRDPAVGIVHVRRELIFRHHSPTPEVDRIHLESFEDRDTRRMIVDDRSVAEGKRFDLE